VPSLADLRIADLLTLLAVQRMRSISAAARELEVTPSQVSKAVTRLERYFGIRLIERGPRGVSITPAGHQVMPRIASAVEDLRMTGVGRKADAAVRELTVAAPSYVMAQVLPGIVRHLPATRIRGLELAPAYLRAYVAERVFDVALVPGGIQHRPAVWTNERVAELRVVLLARPELAAKLGKPPLTIDRVRKLPFISAARTAGERFVALSDDCPLPAEERWIAHEVQSIGVALALAAQTDHVVFGPRIAARRLLESGELVELAVAGWDVRHALYVVCNGDRVLSRVRAAVTAVAQEAFDGA
jgi:LysR family glycine cleavage system transcriptional activator